MTLAGDEWPSLPLLAAIVQPVWLVDAGGLIRFANPAAGLLQGYDPQALVGKSLHDVAHGTTGVTHNLDECPLMGSLGPDSETALVTDDQFVRRDRTTVPAEYWVAPTAWAGNKAAIVMFTDIVQRHQLAEMRDAQRRVLVVADELRAEIARDLHDGAQQHLVNILLSLSRAQQHWATSPEQAESLISLAVAESKTGIADLRRLVPYIYPSILTTRGLAAALDALSGQLPFRLEVDLDNGKLPRGLEVIVYLICSELLGNAALHARATSARVLVRTEATELALDVTDDGVGGAHVEPGGGLAAIADRAFVLGGTLTVSSPPGRGTSIHFRVPVDP